MKTKFRTVPSQLSRTSSTQFWDILCHTAGFCTRPIHDITVKSVKQWLISPGTSSNDVSHPPSKEVSCDGESSFDNVQSYKCISA